MSIAAFFIFVTSATDATDFFYKSKHIYLCARNSMFFILCITKYMPPSKNAVAPITPITYQYII